MKKHLFSVAVAILALTVALSLASCDSVKQTGETTADGHQHSFVLESSTASCTEAGTASLVCECGEKYTVATPAVGHDLVKTAYVAPTCTEEGYVAYECSRCHETSREAIPAVGHSYTASFTAPTCTDDGKITYACSHCDDTHTETVAALGHSYAVTTVDPTCTEAGSRTYACSRCDDTHTEAIPAVGHSYTVTTVEPTCTKAGTRTYTCLKCGASYTEAIPTLAHNYTVTTVEPTCTEAGSRTYACSNCGDSHTEAISAVGHSYAVTVNEPSCTKAGSIVYTCAHCGDTYSEALPAIGHSYAVTARVSPTCTKSGVRVHTCSHCGDSYIEVLPRTEHNYVLDGYENAACTVDGWVHYVCEDCDAEKTEILPHKGHDLKFIETVPATCEDAGYDICECKICHETVNTNETDPLDHEFVFPEGDYFRMVKCEHEGCTVCARRPSENSKAEIFVYCYDDDFKAEVDALYEAFAEALGAVDEYDSETDAYVSGSAKEAEAEALLLTYYVPYIEKVHDMNIQRYVCFLNYNVADGADGWDDEYTKISKEYIDVVSDLNKIYELMYNTEYREYFFNEADGWTEEEIADLLRSIELSTDERFIELTARVNEIKVEARKSDADIPTLYLEFIEVQNEIGIMYGYDNYMDYAYDKFYERDYTPEDVAVMRNFVKQYLGGSAWFELELAYELRASALNTNSKALLKALNSSSALTNMTTSNIAADYLEYFSEVTADTGIDFYSVINDAFKDGLIFTGKYDGAYTDYSKFIDTPYMYFAEGRASVFTLLHESGHYLAFDVIKDYDMSYDLAETQSQGNEMLFLVYLGEYLTEAGYGTVYETMKLQQFAENIAIMYLATCVDEFEQIVYTLEYDGENPAVIAILDDGEIEADELQPLFEALIAEYDLTGYVSRKYWSYVVINSPGYYISYAMSLVPSMTLFVDAVEDFDNAAHEYAKIIDFTDNEDLYDAENHDVIGTYTEILEYAGISGPFTEETYSDLRELMINFLTTYRSAVDYLLDYYGFTSTLVTE